MTKKICRRARRLASALLAVLLALGPSVPALAEGGASGRTLKVAFPTVAGISEIDQYGNYTGLMVDYLSEIAKYTDWEYEFVPVEAAELIDRFLAGDFDLMGGTFYAEDFEEFFAYPDYTMGASRALLLCSASNTSLKSYDLRTLEGKRIGVNENAREKIAYLERFLEDNQLSCQLEYYTYEQLGSIQERMDSGQVDMFLGNEADLNSGFRMLTSFTAQPYYIVTQVGDEETLAQLNRALGLIAEATPGFDQWAYQKNFPDTQTADIQLTEAERAYIAGRQSLKVAVPRQWHPLYCMESNQDLHTGILPEVLESIESFTGLTFTYVYADSYQGCLDLVQQGQADLMGVFLDGDRWAFDQGFALTQPYMSLTTLVLKHKEVRFPDESLTCGLLKGQKLPEDLPAESFRYYDTVEQLVAAVNSGETDYLFGMSALLEQQMQYHRYVNVVPVSKEGATTGAALALPRPAEPELLAILNKAIGTISTPERNAMLSRNLVSVGYNSLTMRDMIYDRPVVFALIVIGVVAVIVAAVMLLARNRVQQALMQNRLQQAEAKSQAKSAFLSRMSHEIRTPMNAIVGLADLTCMEQDVPQAVREKLGKLQSSSQYLLSLINDILDMARIENGKMELDEKNFSLTHLIDQLSQMMGAQAERQELDFAVECQTEQSWLVGDPVRLRQVLTNLLSNAIKFTPAGGRVVLSVRQTARDEHTATIRFAVSDTGIGISQEDQKRIFGAFEQVTSAAASTLGTGLGLPISRSMVELMGGELQVESQPGQGSEFSMTLTFPQGQPESAPVQSAQPASLEGVTVLLAEDNDLNAEIAGEILSGQGMRVQRAKDGGQAVEIFTGSRPWSYQVILMDILMPVKDGYEAAADIRASGRPDADVPIVAMTANSFQEDRERAEQVGMNGFVPKPVDVQLLLKVLRGLI